MKKLISILLLVCICFACAACGKNEPAPAASDTSSDAPAPSSSAPSSDEAEAKAVTVDFRAQAGAEDISEIFDYGGGFVGVIIKKTVDGEKKTYLRFIDTNYGWLADGEYELGGSDYFTYVNRGDEFYICFDSGAVSVSGDPRGAVKVQQTDYKFSYDRDDNLLYSPDGKWYAAREDNDPDKKGDATLVNVETGERITPYVGVRDDDDHDFEDVTASAPVGFAGDKFIFNIYGYEWFYGYGIYDLSTGETQLFDGQYDLGVFPAADHKTDRIPYYINHEEIGYIDLADPGTRKPLYSKNTAVEGSEVFGEVLDGSLYFYCDTVADGKYLGVIAEDANNVMVFAAYDFETFEKVYEYKGNDYPNARVFCGNSAVFLFESVNASLVTVITLP